MENLTNLQLSILAIDELTTRILMGGDKPDTPNAPEIDYNIPDPDMETEPDDHDKHEPNDKDQYDQGQEKTDEYDAVDNSGGDNQGILVIMEMKQVMGNWIP